MLVSSAYFKTFFFKYRLKAPPSYPIYNSLPKTPYEGTPYEVVQGIRYSSKTNVFILMVSHWVNVVMIKDFSEKL